MEKTNVKIDMAKLEPYWRSQAMGRVYGCRSELSAVSKVVMRHGNLAWLSRGRVTSFESRLVSTQSSDLANPFSHFLLDLYATYSLSPLQSMEARGTMFGRPATGATRISLMW